MGRTGEWGNLGTRVLACQSSEWAGPLQTGLGEHVRRFRTVARNARRLGLAPGGGSENVSDLMQCIDRSTMGQDAPEDLQSIPKLSRIPNWRMQAVRRPDPQKTSMQKACSMSMPRKRCWARSMKETFSSPVRIEREGSERRAFHL